MVLISLKISVYELYLKPSYLSDTYWWLSNNLNFGEKFSTPIFLHTKIVTLISQGILLGKIKKKFHVTHFYSC